MNRLTTRFAALLLLMSVGIGACSAPPAPAPSAASAPVALETVAPVVEPAPVTPEDAASTPEVSAPSPVTSSSTNRVFAIDPSRSDASYMVDEEFLGRAVSFVQAVGTTQSIQGQIGLQIDGASLAIGENEFTVDLTTLTSDQPRRDNAIRRDWLQSSTYPLATFKATGVTNLPADAALGKEVAFLLEGEMTIREITKPLAWNVTATLEDATLTGVAQTNLLMRDFGFEPPDIAGMLKVTDGVTVTVNFTAEEVN